jgi:hypothetical protein
VHTWWLCMVGSPTVCRWRVKVPHSGRMLLPAWLHSHRARYAGLLVVLGAHEPFTLGSLQLGSNVECQGGGRHDPNACCKLMGQTHNPYLHHGGLHTSHIVSLARLIMYTAISSHKERGGGGAQTMGLRVRA